MPIRPLAIPWPHLGVNEATAYGDQPSLTTPDARNVRTFEQSTDRARGGSRPGWGKFNDNQIAAGAQIRDLCHSIAPRSVVTYAVNTNPTRLWGSNGSSTIPNLSSFALAVNDVGDLYVGDGLFSITKLNAEGTAQWSRAGLIPADGGDTQVGKLLWIGDGDLYAWFPPFGGTGTGVLARIREGDETFTVLWSKEIPSVVAVSGGIASPYRGTIYLFYDNATQPTLERWDEQPSGPPIRCWQIAVATAAHSVGVFGNPVAADPNGNAFVTVGDPGIGDSRVFKYDAAGAQVWTVATLDGGAGESIAVRNQHVIVTGLIGAAGNIIARKYTDNGTTATAVWTYADAGNSGFASAIDQRNNIYVGTADSYLRFPTGSGTATYEKTSATLGNVFAIAHDPEPPTDADPPISIYTAGSASATTNPFHRFDQATPSIANLSARQITVLAVVENDVYKVPSGASAVSNVGSNLLDTSSRWVMSQAAFGKVFFIDGIKYAFYTHDAIKNAAGDADLVTAETAVLWTARTAGTLPLRMRLIALWQGSILMSGDPEAGHVWYKSAQLDPFDWDYFPVNVLATSATFSGVSPAGQCPDFINALVPINDDLCIFGCDHSIQRLTGNPRVAGQFDLVSDITGMAWGRAWCRDPEGTLYFVGSRGGVYRMPPGGFPESISEGKVEDRLRALNVDPTVNRIRMAWDDNQRGVVLAVGPWTSGSSTHYFWERRRAAWQIDTLPNAQNPLCVHVVDGDAPGDRVVLAGAQDGYVRKLDPDADDDDGTAISSRCVLGPFGPGGLEAFARLVRMQPVMGFSSATVSFDVYSSDTPDYNDIGTAKFSGTWTSGRNPANLSRARGQWFWIKISHATINQRWQFENLLAYFAPAGRTRVT